MNRKGTTIKEIFLMMFLAVAGFGTIIAFTNQMAIDNGGEVSVRVNDSYNRMVSYNNNLTQNLNELANLSNNAEEATVGDFAYFGIRGMVAIMKAPFKLTGVITSGIGDLLGLFTEYIPIQIITTFVTIGLLVLVFAAIKFLTSRGQEP